MSNGPDHDSKSSDDQNPSPWKTAFRQQARSLLGQHRFGRRLSEPPLGRARSEVNEQKKREVESRLQRLVPELKRAEDLLRAVADKRKSVANELPNSDFVRRLIPLESELGESLDDVNEQRDDVRSKVTQARYDSALTAIDELAKTAKAINSRQAEFVKVLIEFEPRDEEAELDNELLRLEPDVRRVLSADCPVAGFDEAKRSLDEAYTEYLTARIERDLEGAAFNMTVVETRLYDPDRWLRGWQEFDGKLQEQASLFSGIESLAPVTERQGELKAETLTGRDDAIEKAKAGEFGVAKALLNRAVQKAVMTEKQPSEVQYDEQYQELEKRIDRIKNRNRAKQYGDPLLDDFADVVPAFEDLHGQIVRHSLQRNFAKARAGLFELAGAIGAVEEAERRHARSAIESAREAASASESRQRILDEVARDPEFLKAVSNEPGGMEWIDSLVKDIGSKASRDQDKQFLIEAVSARFDTYLKRGLECTCGKLKGEEHKGEKCNDCGDKVESPQWSTKALPRLYQLLDMVPKSHTRDNPSLARITRHRNIDASWYDDDEKAVVINAYRAGGFVGGVQDLVVNVMMPIKTGKGPKIVKLFDNATLHEVGHAVDDKDGFMKKHGGVSHFGGWHTTNYEEVVELCLKKILRPEFTSYPEEFLEEFLKVIAARKPKKMKAALSSEEKSGLVDKWRSKVEFAAKAPSPDDLENDPGVQVAEHARALLGPDDRFPDDTASNAKAAIGFQDPYKKLFAQRVITQIIDHRLTAADAVAAVLAPLGTKTDPESNPNWGKLLSSHSVDWLQNVRLQSEDKGLWAQGNGAAKRYAVDGIVYQQAYGNQWYSYDLKARDSLVTDYQFRSPAEWFAEAYMAYFAKKLPEGHPVYTWLQSEEEKEAG